MVKNLKYILLIEVFLLTLQLKCYSQLVTNNSGLIYISNGTIVKVSGDIDNLTGSQFNNNGNLTITGNITNNANISSPGKIDLYGNWTNNSNFLASGGNVFLKGSDQTVGGSNTTTFSKLILNGTGVKSITQIVTISDSLYLNDRTMDIGNNVLYFNNNLPGSLTRTTGFISNNLTGRLTRRTNSTSSYLFPMGSITGTTRYRPVEITPNQNNANKYSVGFVNHDANNDALFRNQTENTICQLNDLYYHHVSIDSGSTSANISIYFDQTNDGNWATSANWKTTPLIQWEIADSASLITGSPFNKINIYNFTFSSTSAFILAKPSIQVELGPDKTGCAGTSFILSPQTTYNSYLWSTGVTTSSINVTNSGLYYLTVTTGSCTAIDSVLVSFLPQPNANAGQNVSICNGSSTQLSASGGTIYTWLVTNNLSNSAIYNPIASPTSTTSYIVEVSNGTCTDTDTVVVTVLTIPTANAGQDATICNGTSSQLNASGGTIYNWLVINNLSNSSINNPFASPTSTTSYIVEISNGICSDKDTVVITVLPSPTANAGTDVTICNDNSTQLNASGGSIYTWLVTNNLSNSAINNPLASPTSTTSYIVEVSNGTCTDTDTVIVIVISNPIANAGQDATICSGLSTQLNASGGISYSWLVSNNLSSSTVSNPTASPNITTSYVVEVSNGTCFDRDTVKVTVLPAPIVNAGIDATVFSGTPYTLSAYAPTCVTAIWVPASFLSNSNILNPIATINDTTIFLLTIYDANGCYSTDSITLFTKKNTELIIYNTFSPNSDGANDTWVVENISQYPDNHLRIYNRNGHLVFDKIGYNNEWDGKYYGSDLPCATYYFVLQIEGFDTFKGDITIIR